MQATWEGKAGAALALACGAPRVVVYDEVPSTMDAAHALAESGAAPGTVVLTDRQTAGRGRGGRTWHSAPGASLTLTLIERPTDEAALAVLSLRLGLAVAPVMDRHAAAPVRLKWPNDLFIGEAKAGGILVEARWRNQRPEWVAIGIGINVRRPSVEGTAGLATTASRAEILADLVPVLRAAAAREGPLGESELAAYRDRDWARGRAIVQPARGIAAGVSPEGALLVQTESGLIACGAGSLVLSEA